MNWQPISTAPKDGTAIDIWNALYGRLCNYQRVEMSKGNVFYDPVEDGPCCIRDVSHWLPIPEAPPQAYESKPKVGLDSQMGRKLAAPQPGDAGNNSPDA